MSFDILQVSIRQNFETLILHPSAVAIPKWFSHQSPGLFVTIPLPLDLCDNSSWRGIVLYGVFDWDDASPEKNFILTFGIMRSDMVGGLVCISRIYKCSTNSAASSVGFHTCIPALKLRDRLDECSCITVVACGHSVNIKNIGARLLYDHNLVEFQQAVLLNDDWTYPLPRSSIDYQFQGDEAGSSQSNGQSDLIVILNGKLKSLLSKLYQVSPFSSPEHRISLFSLLSEHPNFMYFTGRLRKKTQI